MSQVIEASLPMSDNEPTPSHTISLVVNNKPGVLIRVALVFSRRAFNIDSLCVSPSNGENLSRCTIVASGDKEALRRIVDQLNKLVDVIHAEEHPQDDTVVRELALVKVGCPPTHRVRLAEIAAMFDTSLQDDAGTTSVYEVVGSKAEVDDFVRRIEAEFDVMELVRTGAAAVADSPGARGVAHVRYPSGGDTVRPCDEPDSC